MIRAVLFVCLATPAFADLDAALDDHILPRMAELARATDALAAAPCDDMRAPFAEAALAWAAVSHLTFDPAEVDGRARAILFWPDDRDATARGLRLLQRQDPDA